MLPRALIEGDRLTIENLRFFAYRPDGSVEKARYETRSYDLSKLDGVWYGISHFARFGLAHTFLSFEFADGAYLTLSVEARQTKDQSYNPFWGLLRAYELIYIAADERDSHRGAQPSARREGLSLRDPNRPGEGSQAVDGHAFHLERALPRNPLSTTP